MLPEFFITQTLTNPNNDNQYSGLGGKTDHLVGTKGNGVSFCPHYVFRFVTCLKNANDCEFFGSYEPIVVQNDNISGCS